MISQKKGGDIYIDLYGMEEVQTVLRVLPNKFANKTLVRALVLGAKPIRQRARDLAAQAKLPHKFKDRIIQPGNLKRSIGYKAISKTPPAIFIGPNRGSGRKYNAFYAHWVEFGQKNNDKFPKQPFMRPAFDEKKKEAIKIIRDYLRGIVLELAK